ncbi:glycoside hydrolase family 61 protein [Pseudohyphozyma bogoriensis]|nr:glycoside hydrolase family 61 protein [Pseudohyphozyma bogoriensis]
MSYPPTPSPAAQQRASAASSFYSSDDPASPGTARLTHNPDQSRSSADIYASVPLHDHADTNPLSPLGERDPMLVGGRAGEPRGSLPPRDDSFAGSTMSREASSMLYGDNESQMAFRNGRESSGGIAAAGLAGAGYGTYRDADDDHVNHGDVEKTAYGTAQKPVSRGLDGRRAAAGGSALGAKGSSRRKWFIVLGIVVLLVVAAAIAIPVAVTKTKNNSNKLASANVDTSSSSSGSATSSAPAGVPTGAAVSRNAAYGGDGSTVYTEDGSSFIYNNTFGGFWNSIPFNDSAQAQSDVPALKDEWDYNNNLIYGVNIGGWLVVEPFIVPGLFEPFNSPADIDFEATVIDEYTLSQALGSNLSTTLENHYKTFITEKDFAEIAGAGLNWIRLPVPYWMIETYEGEPFLANVGWTYFLKAVEWARKYGLRINLDLHAVPGSQNGYNHSSKQGTINFLNGVMGIANAQRTLNIIRTLAEFITQPQYKNVFPMFSVLNEPYAATIGVDVLRHFYLETYNLLRGITGTGAGNGAYIVFHDGFTTQNATVAAGGWNGFLPGADRMVLDSHPYLCFSTPNNDGLSYQATKPCQYWGAIYNQSSVEFGITVAGEWSLAVNDCGKWLNNVGNGYRYNGTYYIPGNTTAPVYAGIGSCDQWNNWDTWTSDTKNGFQQIAQSHQDAFGHWFFWTWKTGFSTHLGKIANPLWNYQLALEQGYMPANPRLGRRDGACAAAMQSNDVTMASFAAPTLSAWMTGGAGAGTMLNPTQAASYSQWPPASLGATPASNLPTYTPTGSVITLSATTPTAYPSGYSSVTDAGNGWAQPTDTAGWETPVAGCSYPNPWSGAGAPVPTAPCVGNGSAKRMRRQPVPTALAMPTPPPKANFF